MATDVNKPVSPVVRNAPPKPQANAAANNAAANNSAANNKPAANKPAAANNAPAANKPADDEATSAAANTTTVDAAPEAAPAKEKPNHFLGFFEGFVREGAETVAGLYTLVTTNPITTAKGLVYMATHPAQAVQAITEPYTTAYKDGKYGELAGRVGFQVLTVVLTSGALSKSNKASTVAKPTANMTATATKVTEDLAQKIGAKRAAAELIKINAERAAAGKAPLAGAAASKKMASLAAQFTEKTAENLAKRGIADKLATRIAGTGLADDAVTKIMGAGGANVSASQSYRYAAAGLKHGMKPAEIAANLAKFGISKEAAAKLPAATRVLFAAGPEAVAIAGAGSVKSAEAIAQQLQKLEKLAASSSDKGVKAAAKAQADAIRAALAKNAPTERIVNTILSGEKVGAFKRIGAQIDSGIEGVARTGKNISETGGAVKNALNRPNTIGGYVEAVGAIPTAIGNALEAAYQGTLRTLKEGLKHLPKFEMPKLSWEKIAATRVPSPWEILTSPVTVPLGAAGWALKNPGRALGVAGMLGDVGNAAKTGERLAERAASDKVDENDAGPGFKWYELKDGDTLEDIAKRELGDPAKWEEIYLANKELFDSLGEDGVIAVGTKIKIPTGGADAPANNGPSNVPANNGPAANDGAAQQTAYKTALLGLIDDELKKSTDPKAKEVLTALKAKIAGMTPAEVYALKPKLEAQGLVVDAPAANAPANNGPANAPATNTPPANAPSNNGPANAPSNNGPVAPTTPTAPVKPPAPPQPQFVDYTVKRGDTLTGIAQNELGDWNKWGSIVDANKDKYPSLTSNPDFIQIGWNLQLPTTPAAPAKPPAPGAIGNTTGTPEKPGPTAPAPAPAAGDVPPAPTGADRQNIVKQFNLDGSDANFQKFWNEVATYPKTSVGPDTGTEADRKGLQGLLGKLGYDVPVTGDYFAKGADGKPQVGPDGNPVSPTADAVVHFKRLAGINQGYNVMGPNGKPVPDVNEYVDTRTRESMIVALRLLQDPNVRQQASMEAAVREAARLQKGSIGPEVGSKDARVLVERYLDGLGYNLSIDGTFDKATTDAIIDFKKKNGIAASYKDDKGQPVYTPYVDGRTADALYNAIKQLGTKK